MSKRWRWAYLCTDVRKLMITDAFARSWLPESDLIWTLCIPDDWPTRDEIVAASKNTLVSDVLLISNEVPWYNSERYTNTFFGEQYENLGHKVTLPSYMLDDDVLYTDDDVVIRWDPNYLIANRPWMSHDTMLAYNRYNERTTRELEAWCRVFNWESLSVDFWRRIRTDAGVAFFPAQTRDNYTYYLHKFFTEARKLDLYGIRFRMLDQRFWTCWNLYTGGHMLHSRDGYGLLLSSSPPKNLPNKVILHYPAGRHKPKYVDWLEEYAKNERNT